MTRQDLSREWFDINQALRSQIGTLKIEAGLAAHDLPGEVAAGAARIAILVERFDKILMGYVASAESGAHST